MAGKGLSNSTLSLRFMQNAHRAKQQAQVEAEQAKIKDDAEWEVPSEIRDAWGIGSSSSKQTAIHEASYVPFIFPALPAQDTSTSDDAYNQETKLKPKGRRKFNSSGQEVALQEKHELQGEGAQAPSDTPEDDGHVRPLKRLTSISGFKVPLTTARKDDRRKTAKQIIREDLVRAPPRPAPAENIAPITGFLKPSGVDEPAAPMRNTVKDAWNSADKSLKRDRERGADSQGSSADVKKRRKKKDTP